MNTPRKVIVAGSRTFENYKMVRDVLVAELMPGDEIVSGACPTGADYMGEYFGRVHGFKITRFPADWNKHGKKAGPLRNEEMAKYADALIAFWDGQSPGTKNMIDLAEKHKLKIRIVLY